jgi:hypothetical protein
MSLKSGYRNINGDIPNRRESAATLDPNHHESAATQLHVTATSSAYKALWQKTVVVN